MTHYCSICNEATEVRRYICHPCQAAQSTKETDIYLTAYLMGSADANDRLKVAKEFIDDIAESLKELRKVAGCRTKGTGTCLHCDYLCTNECNATGKDAVLNASKFLKRLDEAKAKAYKNETKTNNI